MKDKQVTNTKKRRRDRRRRRRQREKERRGKAKKGVEKSFNAEKEWKTSR